MDPPAHVRVIMTPELQPKWFAYRSERLPLLAMGTMHLVTATAASC